ncbi:hypothetical protein [Phenylobacterium sp.]|uniref:hypothetical protein n=1 Tax=Phenylobacterium sp. TaxID=1871053 RepID=UPI00273524E3|nr:hypothetical protein [Phenylobacterium sp.]MDP3660473.1 hypothetical protein [Phenylobacterium sp.]
MTRFATLTAMLAVLTLPGVALAHTSFDGLNDTAEADITSLANDAAAISDIAAIDPFSLLNAPELALADEPAASGGLALAEADLEGERGGFMTPLGLDIGFGAVVRTTIDGAVALESRLTWDTQTGAKAPEILQGAPTADLAGAAAAGGIKLGDTSGWNGVVIPGSGGATAVLQQLNGGGITNLTLNTANDRTIEQHTDITLTIPGFDALTADMMRSRVGSNMQSSLDLALTNAAN